MSAGRAPNPPGMAGRMAANAIVQAVGIPIQSLVSLGTFAAITRYLGPAAFGDYTAAMVYLFIPTVVADIGLSAIVLRDISTEPERMERVVRAAASLRLIISAAAVGVTAVVGLALPFDDRAKVAILIGSAGSFLTLLNLSLLPVLQAQLRMHWAVIASVVGRLATLVITLVALAAGLGFKAVIVAYVVGLGIIFLIDLRAVWSVFPVRPLIDTAYWRGFLRSSLVLGAGLAISQIYFRIDAVILALLRPAAEVGLYGSAYKFVEFAQALSYAAVISIVPALTNLAARGDARFKQLAQNGFEVLMFVAIPVAIAMACIPATLLDLTAGPKFTRAADALQILAFYPLFAFTNGLIWRMLIAVHRERRLLLVASTILVLNVALNFALIPRYGFRAAAVTSIASEAVSLALALVLAWKQFGFLPSLGYVPRLAVAGVAMAAITKLLPVAPLAALAVGLVIYLALLLAGPGAVRATAAELVGWLRTAVARR